ncbi:MAG: 6-pyruvoyl-tetrahydropterin synthase-related protein [Lachnospiraceae bacterium]
MKNQLLFIKSILQKDTASHYLLLLLLCTLLCFPLLQGGLNIGDDYFFQMHRVLGTVNAFFDGQIIPMFDPTAANGYGYSWNAVYSPFSAYCLAFLKIFFSTYTASFKVYIFLTLLLSGIFMYGFVKEAFSSSKTALVSALLFMSAPYHLIDIYFRTAVAEYTAFVFLPLLFWGIYRLLYRDGQKCYLLTIGAAGLVLSHNLTAFMVLPFIVYFVIINFKVLKSKIFWKHAVINITLTMMICMLNIAPMIEFMKSAPYYVFQPGTMSTTLEGLGKNAKRIVNLLSSTNYSFRYGLGPLLVTPLILSPYAICKSFKNKQNRALTISFTFLSVITIFLVSNQMNWLDMPQIFGKIQFPWRYLAFANFFMSIVAGITIESIFEKIDMKIVFSAFLVIVIITFPFLDERANADTYSDQILQDKSITAHGEYLTVNAEKNRDYASARNDQTIVLSGDSIVKQLSKEGSHLETHIVCESDAVLELPYYYYPGFKVVFTDDSGNETRLKYTESDYGFVQIFLDDDSSGILSVKYTGTAIMKISYIVSIIGAALLLLYAVRQSSHSKHPSPTS